MRYVAMVLVLLVLMGCTREPPIRRFALVGHLYSAYVHSQTTDGVHQIERPYVVEALAEDFATRKIDTAFFLGDITTDSREDEWQMLAGIFDKTLKRRYYVAGNHDLKNPENFYKYGGLKGHQSLVAANNKFLLLDVKNWFEAEDLAWIEGALADADRYDHVVVLMHYLLPTYKAELKEGVDPNTPYSGISNWSTEVVPLLTGKVHTVICGDLARPEGVRQLGGQRGDIDYILTSFLFAGEGPLIYLELEIQGKELAIYPRALPLDVRDPWYNLASKRPPPKK